MKRSIVALALVAAGMSFTAFAQQPAAGGAAVVATAPGQAVAARTVEISARVVGIDRGSRTVTLKGPKGNVLDVVAGDEVRNFDQVRLGDMVVARYTQAVTLQLLKASAGIREAVEREGAVRAPAGDKPAAAAGRQIVVIADVIDVDAKSKTVTLKGPKGNVVALQMAADAPMPKVKKGDQVEASYTEAVALSVEPAAKKK